jgi:hypothetical protein
MIHSKRTVDWVLLRPLWLLRTRMSFVVTNLQVRRVCYVTGVSWYGASINCT